MYVMFVTIWKESGTGILKMHGLQGCETMMCVFVLFLSLRV